MARRFVFDLFRLNIVDIYDIFQKDGVSRLRGDDELRELLRTATDSSQDEIQETKTAIFKWSLRECCDFTVSADGRALIYVVLARSVLEKEGLIVTDQGLSSGVSASHPPLASAAVCFFDISRHLVVVEHTGELSQTAWKDFLEQILRNAARKMQRFSSIELEPVPERFGIIGLFRSFDRLTRMKVTLRIPNPELTRYTKSLYDDLSAGGIREYTQDMKNPGGLSKLEEARPFASAVLAEQGYKKGEVQFEGFRNDGFEKVSSGLVAARGGIAALRDFVRGMNANAKAKETKSVLRAICDEIDKLHPLVNHDD